MKKYVFGVDIGGTTVKLGFFTVDGELLDKWEITTRKDEGGRFILPDVAQSIEDKMAEKNVDKEDVAGVGIGVPGPVRDDGTVLRCVNLGWGVFNVANNLHFAAAIAFILMVALLAAMAVMRYFTEKHTYGGL